ncbi:hypothetical protein I41_48770 [Lacipirellula limnantheis]|uniref:Uncharacterized protein n=2 Tax=Lacipirellula limnantheis TaxID=2528024 RepID=A0A517U4T2_9BACT|nr:hypothetical protein I41_48770 [Lacipirellula limnantheis]
MSRFKHPMGLIRWRLRGMVIVTDAAMLRALGLAILGVAAYRAENGQSGEVFQALDTRTQSQAQRRFKIQWLPPTNSAYILERALAERNFNALCAAASTSCNFSTH